jgi:hypothetical protein
MTDATNFKPLLTITEKGLQLAIWPYRINWDSKPVDSYEWLTDVLTAYSGKEQRRSIRTAPRRTLEYSYLLQSENTVVHDLLLGSRQAISFAVPAWLDKVRLSTKAEAGDTVLQVDSNPYALTPDGLAIIYLNERLYEVVRVEGSSISEINLTGSVQYDWPAGASVYPLQIAHMETSVPVTRYTDSVLSGQVSFKITPVVNESALVASEPTEEYLGYEILTKPPNWREPIDIEFVNDFKTADGQSGAVKFFSAAAASQIRPYRFLLKNRAEIEWFKGFLDRRRGRAIAFWVQSWHKGYTLVASSYRSTEDDDKIRSTEDGDFRVLESTLDADRKETFFIAGTEFATFFATNPNRYLFIKMYDLDRYTRLTESEDVRVTEDGRVRVSEDYHGVEYYCRKVVNAAVVGNASQLLLDEPLNGVLSLEDVEYIRPLLHCRLATDKVEITMETDGVCQPTLSFKSIPL